MNIPMPRVRQVLLSAHLGYYPAVVFGLQALRTGACATLELPHAISACYKNRKRDAHKPQRIIWRNGAMSNFYKYGRIKDLPRQDGEDLVFLMVPSFG